MKNFNKTAGQTSTPLLADFLTSRPTKGDNASNSLKIFRQNAYKGTPHCGLLQNGINELLHVFQSDRLYFVCCYFIGLVFYSIAIFLIPFKELNKMRMLHSQLRKITVWEGLFEKASSKYINCRI